MLSGVISMEPQEAGSPGLPPLWFWDRIGNVPLLALPEPVFTYSIIYNPDDPGGEFIYSFGNLPTWTTGWCDRHPLFAFAGEPDGSAGWMTLRQGPALAGEGPLVQGTGVGCDGSPGCAIAGHTWCSGLRGSGAQTCWNISCSNPTMTVSGTSGGIFSLNLNGWLP